MEISKAKYDCLRQMTDDLMEAEYFVNTIGIETRTNKNGDKFRKMKDILQDVALVVSNNPTILEDCEKFLQTNPTSSDETDEFLSPYNLEGIFKL